MTKTTKVMIVLAVLIVALLATPVCAEAQVRWRRSRTIHAHRHPASHVKRTPARSPYNRSPRPARYDYYPKYTGGFHARYFDGIPSIYGTQPMRGTAW